MGKIFSKVVWLSVLGLLLTVSIASAQTTATDTDQLVGVDVEEVTSMPTTWGLWWSSVKEKLSEWTTFDPVEKAAKQLEFAEQRMQYAEYIAENAVSDDEKELALKLVAKADRYMEKIEDNKDKWRERVEAAKGNLAGNLATYQVRKEKVMDKLENVLSEDEEEDLLELRVQAIERSQRLINVLTNVNLSTTTRQHLQSVKARIDAQLNLVRNFQQQKKTLLQKAKSGDSMATTSLQQLQDHRRTQIKANVETYQQTQTQLRQQIRATSTDGTVSQTQVQTQTQVKAQIHMPDDAQSGQGTKAQSGMTNGSAGAGR